jgi:predicted aspartyl protease
MIQGQVNARREAIIPIQVLDQNRQTVNLQATVDTGFSGFLSLPLAQINALQLLYDRTEIFTIGSKPGRRL